MNKFARRLALVAAPVALMAAQAHAAIDVTTATGGIADASTAVVTVLGAMITMGAAVFGLKKVLRLIGR
jgi:hypothetical protein